MAKKLSAKKLVHLLRQRKNKQGFFSNFFIVKYVLNTMQNKPSIASDFLLHPDVTFLNFGSFGACPKPIFEAYQNWQREIEREPVQFFKYNMPKYLQQSRQALASYIDCAADDVVYVTNPSYAVNIIAKSFALQPGDEVLTTNLEYGACDKSWQYYCDKAGATYVQQPIQLPIVSKEQFIEDFFKGCTAKTKLIFISHITSSTGIVFPVKEICTIAKQKGILTFVDGAHAPGHIALSMQDVGADMYTGACHKWMMTPKGSSFLYVNQSIQHLFDPLIVSWGYKSAMPSGSMFLDYHQQQGTRDISAFLCIETAIAYMQQNDWQTKTAECKKLVLYNAAKFFTLLQAQPICPLDSNWIGQMLSIPILTNNAWELEQHLYSNYNITIPVMQHGNNVFIRYSIAAFNTQQDVDVLYNALQQIILEGKYAWV
jgi:isopenicillin-N epimerase